MARPMFIFVLEGKYNMGGTGMGVPVDMQVATLYLFLLIVVPTLGGLLCMTRRRGTSPWMLVAGTSLFTVVLAVGFLVYMSFNHITTVSVNADELFPMEWVILSLDLLLIAYFIYVGVKERSRWIVAFAFLQIVPMVIFESAIGGRTADPVIFADYLSIVMMLITWSGRSSSCTRYGT